MSVAPLVLGLVHGHIGFDQEILNVRSIFGVQRNADAGRHHETVPAAVERFSQGLLNSVGDHCRLRLLGEPGQQHHELIAPQARDSRLLLSRRFTRMGYDVGGSDALLQPACNILQQCVAHGVSQVIVDSLKAVEVQVKERHEVPGSLGSPDGTTDLAHK